MFLVIHTQQGHTEFAGPYMTVEEATAECQSPAFAGWQSGYITITIPTPA